MVERRPNYKGVLLTLYVESRNREFDRKKRIDQVGFSSRPRVLATRGCDRRAQLLSYSRELRRVDGERVTRPLKDVGRKSKKRKWGVVAGRIKELFSRFRGTRRVWKYERIVTENCGGGEGKLSYGRKGRRKSHFCKKVMGLFKKVCGAWDCKNGAY